MFDLKAQEAEAASVLADVEDVLKTLTYREREVVRLRFGLTEEGQEYTLRDIGKMFKVTRERARQVEAKALRKLQHPLRAPRWNRFLDYCNRRKPKEPSNG